MTELLPNSTTQPHKTFKVVSKITGLGSAKSLDLVTLELDGIDPECRYELVDSSWNAGPAFSNKLENVSQLQTIRSL